MVSISFSQKKKQKDIEMRHVDGYIVMMFTIVICFIALYHINKQNQEAFQKCEQHYSTQSCINMLN